MIIATQSVLQLAKQELSGNHSHTSPDSLIANLIHLLESHDALSASHAIGVALQADAIAIGMEMNSDHRQKLWRAALMHDIGKLDVPAEILRSASSLNPEALKMIRRHPAVGAELMERSAALRELAPFVRHHHERWDGTGYPSNLRGEEIPLEARIIGLCDAVHSMSMTRPYQGARPADQIIREVERCAGSQFDLALVAVFRRSRGTMIFVPSTTRASHPTPAFAIVGR